MAKDYEVLKIMETVRMADLGGIEKYYRHTIRTKGGTVLSVDISEADFTEDRAAPILAARALNADKILKL
uniref:Uncharacterized protein n=1 Tax=viral metagenome TaxID=1070528 RepID=A0A6H2A2C4_9ZZZZ